MDSPTMSYCLLLMSLTITCTTTSVSQTPCVATSYIRGLPVSPLNTDLSTLPGQIANWLYSLDIAGGEVVGQSRRYHQVTRRYVPAGHAWRWRSSTTINGFLYGLVDQQGEFTGENITFIYPDFLTGLRGSFENGALKFAMAVDVVAERCNKRVKELKIEPSKHNYDVIWENEDKNLYQYGKNPQVMDPHERKSVYVGQSTNPRANEGLFARRHFAPGDLVSYYGGQKLFLADVIFANMTAEEMTSATMNTLALGKNVQELLVDVTAQYRSVEEYRTTLGHKANHRFEKHNVEYRTGVDHPVLGDIACLVATTEIDPGEEIFANYNYNIELAAPWYRQEYDHLYGKCYEYGDWRRNTCSQYSWIEN